MKKNVIYIYIYIYVYNDDDDYHMVVTFKVNY